METVGYSTLCCGVHSCLLGTHVRGLFLLFFGRAISISRKLSTHPALVAQLVERGTSNAEVYGSNPYGSSERRPSEREGAPLAGWCSWLSRILNTDKVLGSNPSLVILFAFASKEVEDDMGYV